MKRLLKICSCLVAVLLFLTSCQTLGDNIAFSFPEGITVEGNKKVNPEEEISIDDDKPEDAMETNNSFEDTKTDSHQTTSTDVINGSAPASSDSLNQNTSSKNKEPIEVKNIQNVIREEAKNLRLTQTILERSVVDAGNMARLAKVIRKAVQGEAVTIGVIGGSITEGTGASTGANKYAERFKAWWRGTFPDSTLTFVNAGIGATDSMIGVHRADTDLLSHDPDLVIVEFSVNDTASQADLYRESYESLLRKILLHKNAPAIICLSVFDQNRVSMQSVHEQIAKHYHLPIISYRDAIWPENGTKVFAWNEIGADNIHPNDTGHAVISELLIYYINTVRAQIEQINETESVLPAPLTEAGFENGTLLTNKNLSAASLGSFQVNNNAFRQFKNGWSVSGGNEPIVFQTKGKSIYILYKRDQSSGKAGTVTVTMDGTEIGKINADFSTGWGDNAWFYKVTDTGVSAQHTIEIQLSSTGNKSEFAILGLMVS